MWNQLKTILLFGALTALLIGIGGALAPNSIWLFVAIAVVMNVGAYFFSDRMVLAMYRAREIPPDQAPELHAIVDELAREANLPRPRLYLIPSPQPNAFATGRNPQHGVVAVTEGIVSMLDRRELRGVLAHEMSHIKHRDILISTVAAIIATAITTLANVLSFGAMFGGRSENEERNPLAMLVAILVAPLAATLIQLAISRSREFAADEGGAKLSGDPDALASALVKLDATAKRIPAAEGSPATASLFIVNPFGALDSMARWFSTHPSLEERVARLRQMRGTATLRTRYAG